VRRSTKKIVWFLVVAFSLFSFNFAAFGQTTEFTYQGSLKTSGAPANGNFDFEFALFNVATGGAPIAATITRTNVAVTNGVFSVSLNFGDSFNGIQRFLEIRVRPTGGGALTVLAPRQQFLSAPYSLYSRNAENALLLSGVTASEFTLTTDSRLSDARQPLPGSANYIQNTTTQQTSSNFNISGTGTANVFNAATQYNILNVRFISGARGNTLVGFDAGINTTGTSNSFFGNGAGQVTTTGAGNSFFGSAAGNNNTTGGNNSFFGSGSGRNNIGGSFNSFFGIAAGLGNTSGIGNSFFGANSGDSNTTGNDNSFFGRLAGSSNTTGTGNSFFGRSAGLSNVDGDMNAFFGFEAGRSNTVAFNNSFFGYQAGLANTSATNNSFFGFQAGLATTTGGGNSFFGATSGADNTTGSDNAFFGVNSGRFNTTGIRNTFLGRRAGNVNTTGINNTFVGFSSGDSNITGSNNSTLGANADIVEGVNVLNFATAIGAGATVDQSNTIVLGRDNDTVRIPGRLFMSFSDEVRLPIGSKVQFANFVSTNGDARVCFTNSADISGFVLGLCSSSLRYKTNIQNLTSGLDAVMRLRPVSFEWKKNGKSSLGLIAEEASEVEPLLAVRNQDGVIETVNYDGVTVILVNAVKEQQTQIEAQQKQIDEQKEIIKKQQAELDAVRQFICSQNPAASICQPKN
jgi:hypothetical protein